MHDYTEQLRTCYHEASKSPDPSTQVGAMLVNSFGSGVLMACNTFPEGVKYSEERLQKPLKYDVIEHAEAAVIHKAAKYGIKTDGMVLVCTWASCAGCVKAIINAGITHVVGHKLDFEFENWQESIEIGKRMLDEAGVMRSYVDALFGIKIRFGGKEVLV